MPKHNNPKKNRYVVKEVPPNPQLNRRDIQINRKSIDQMVNQVNDNMNAIFNEINIIKNKIGVIFKMMELKKWIEIITDKDGKQTIKIKEIEDVETDGKKAV